MNNKLVIGGLIAAIGVALIPIYLIPKSNPTIYHDIQKTTRKDIIQDEVQPGNMKIWSDPFDRKKK